MTSPVILLLCVGHSWTGLRLYSLMFRHGGRRFLCWKNSNFKKEGRCSVYLLNQARRTGAVQSTSWMKPDALTLFSLPLKSSQTHWRCSVYLLNQDRRTGAVQSTSWIKTDTLALFSHARRTSAVQPTSWMKPDALTLFSLPLKSSQTHWRCSVYLLYQDRRTGAVQSTSCIKTDALPLFNLEWRPYIVLWSMGCGSTDSAQITTGSRLKPLARSFVHSIGRCLVQSSYFVQNYWVSELYPSSGILNTRKLYASKTGSISVFRWWEGVTFSVWFLRKS
jgi:hypothetical protein